MSPKFVEKGFKFIKVKMATLYTFFFLCCSVLCCMCVCACVRACVRACMCVCVAMTNIVTHVSLSTGT